MRLCFVPPNIAERALQIDVDRFLDEFITVSLDDLNITRMLTQFMALIRQHRLVLPSNVALLVRVVLELEGTSRLLNRDFNLTELVKPYYVKILARRFEPEKLLKTLQKASLDWARLLDTFPRQMSDIMQRMGAGKFEVNLQHHRLDVTVNRLIYGLLVSALILSSALLFKTKVPPLIWDISVIGLITSALAFYLGFKVIRSIKKSGGLREKPDKH